MKLHELARRKMIEYLASKTVSEITLNSQGVFSSKEHMKQSHDKFRSAVKAAMDYINHEKVCLLPEIESELTNCKINFYEALDIMLTHTLSQHFTFNSNEHVDELFTELVIKLTKAA